MTRYCSREHQKADWKKHKRICEDLKFAKEYLEETCQAWKLFDEEENGTSSTSTSTPNTAPAQQKNKKTESSKGKQQFGPSQPSSSASSSKQSQGKDKAKSTAQPKPGMRTVRMHCTPLSFQEVKPWDFYCEIPASLIIPPEMHSSPPPTYEREFGEAMPPIIAEHQNEFNTRSGPKCLVCKEAPTRYGKTFCVSQLHTPEPFVVIGIVLTCGTKKCVEGASELMKIFRADQMKYDAEHACKVCGKFEGSRPCSKCGIKWAMYCSAEHEERDWPNHKIFCKGPSMARSCEVCGKSEGLKPCSACKSARYCSVEHQKRDWPIHKGICKALKSIHDLAEETGHLGLE